uniref:Kinesin motor domain-containing protein n=2 Tax=Gouania willdenowi TaxID=441366 RepID=A0A8C5HRP5_GOUWI
MRSMNKCKPCHSELGPIVLSLLNGHKTTPSRGSKLSMLLRESLGHANCHIAVMADVGDSRALLHETFATIQLASRIRRTQKRTKQSTSCSPCGRSLTREKRGPQSLSLRAFHSTDEVDVDTRPFRLRGELDERSSSDQSCDTVIRIDLEGLAHSKVSRRPTQPEFVPIIPSLHPNKADLDDPEFNALLQELLRIPQLKGEKKSEEASQENAEGQSTGRTQSGGECLKCDTFAELQERLGCIDGSEIAIDLLKSSLNGASFNNVAAKLHQFKESGKNEASVPQAVFNQGLDCKQSSAKEKLTDGAFLGDSFQREDSGLYDCEECSANSSSEEPLNQTLRNCRSTPKSGNEQDIDSAAQSKALTSSFASQPSQRRDKSETADWFKPDKRTSPVGKSSPISLSSSCTSSPPLAKSVVLGDVLPQLPTSDVKDMKATITVTVKQPLDLKGQDEIVFSMVEEVTISGAYDRGGAGGSIICIRDPAQSQAHVHSTASSQPVRIISNISEESEATVSSNETKSPVAQPGDGKESTGNPKYPLRREKGFLPSFINPMLMNTAADCELDDVKEKEGKESTAVKAETESKRKDVVNLQVKKVSEKRSEASETSVKKLVKKSYSLNDQDIPALEDVCLVLNSTENKICDRRLQDKDTPRDCRHVYSTNSPKIPEGVQPVTRLVGNTPNRIGASPSCQETTLVFSKTSSLPRGWLNTNHQQLYQSCHTANNHKDPRGVTSSASSSPGVTLERRQVRQPLPVGRALHFSSPQKQGTEFKQGACGALKMCAESMFETLSPSLNHPLSPTWDSGRFFSAKLEQISSRTNSLGRMPRDFSSLERGSSNSSVSSKGSIDGASKPRCKGSNNGECTFPRASRSPRRNPQPDQGHHFFHSENIAGHSVRHNHSKLSAVGKLKITTPKVRRLSAPSIKNLNLPRKNVQQSNNRSASLSPDGKAVSYERTSSFFSSSPPRSFRSISRTPSQSSSCSSTKSAIHGFVNGRISDLLKESVSSSTSGPDQLPLLPSPYSQMTAPRISDYSNGHASDTTSVLSGDLPPAMGKTSLYFSNRSSLVSSGYDSMLRDSEATCTSRDSVSDKSGSLLSVSRSSRSSRRRGTTGAHPRRVSQDAPTSLRRSTSGLKSRWMDRGIPEAYEITVYEIDNMQRKQKKSGAKHHAEGFGASAAEGLRGVTRILPEEKSRDGQTQPQAGARHLEPRPRPVADVFRGLPGAPGGP